MKNLPHVTFIILTLAFSIYAKLKPDSLSHLIDSSQIIVEGSLIGIDTIGNEFITKVAVNKIYRGGTIKFVHVKWSNEEHDYQLNKLELKYLLFLHDCDSNCCGTVYGRSYWPIKVTMIKNTGNEVIFFDWRMEHLIGFPQQIIRKNKIGERYFYLNDFLTSYRLIK
jgi:hypothetical protein